MASRSPLGVRPVKAGLFGFLLDLLSPPESGEGLGYGIEGIGVGLLGFFFPLQIFPVGEDLVGAADRYVPKHVGVAENQLLADTVGHVLQIEPASVLLNVGMKDHLEEHVPQLFLQVPWAFLIDGFNDLTAFLYETTAEGGVGLFHIPGTPPGGAKNGNNVFQVLHAVAFFPYKIYHILPHISRGFFKKIIEFSGFWRFCPPWA